jgi:UDP-glucose 4-epimerase
MPLSGLSKPSDLAGTQVCITGGAGFIGSHLVEALLTHGAQVTVLDDFSSGSPENLPVGSSGLQIVEGSILDPEQLSAACKNASVVFHHAALVSVPESFERPEEYQRVNVEGTRQVLEHSRAAGVSRVVYAGSCSAYGNLPGLPKSEHDPVEPTSPYAQTKFDGELLVEQHAAEATLDTVRLRYFNIFGPRQAHDSPYAAVVPKFVEALQSGGTPLIFGDGGQTRDFVHVRDVVQANLLAASCPERIGGQVINVGSGHRISILEVLEIVAASMGVPMAVEYRPERPGEVRDSEASIELARQLLGYDPSYSLADSISEIQLGLQA